MAIVHCNVDDVLIELVKDHYEVGRIFATLERVRPAQDRQEMVKEAITVLVRHGVAEERYVYPTVREVLDDGDAVADRGVAEHDEIEALLKRLESLTPDHAEFEATLQETMSAVRRHVEAEEGDLCPRLRHACTPERLRELGDGVRAAKAVDPTHQHPTVPGPAPSGDAAAPLSGLVDQIRHGLSQAQPRQ